MWHGGTPPRLEHLRTFGARAFVHEERYVKKLTMKAWEGRMVGYGKDSKTYRIWESGTKIVESRNVTFIETFPVRLNAFDRDHNDGNDDTFLDLESSSIALGTQEMPETEADDEPDTDDSQSGGTLSNVDEESDSDIDSRPSEAAKAKRIARQLRQLGDYNKGSASANVTSIYPLRIYYQPSASWRTKRVQSLIRATGKPWRQRKLWSGKHLWKGSSQACPNTTFTN